MKRRTLLAGVGAGGLASLSGCLGLLGMDAHEATPAGVDAAVREQTGYEQTNVDELVVEESVGIGGVSEDIVVSNALTEHEKEVDIAGLVGQRAAVFSVLTTPQVGVLGRNFNPVEDMDARELVELIEDNYDAIDDISFEEETSITILGESTTRSRFSADAVFNGQGVEVDLHITEAVDAGDDLLVTIGVYPQELRSRGEDNVTALMEGIIEDVEDADGADGDDGNGDGESGEEDGDDDGDGDGGESDEDGDEGDSNDEDDGGLLDL